MVAFLVDHYDAAGAVEGQQNHFGDVQVAFRAVALALEFIGKGLIDVTPLITASKPIESAREAFELASDRSRSMKVQIAF
ncbi:MAG TPA: hypothetical protein DHU96_01835 [Actinobacteria bacterium]|nr:hypothetical protein [Actinomycetota bacterium]